MTIETERLILRRFTLDDADDYFHLIADPEVNLYTGQGPVTSIEEARQVLRDHPLRDYDTVGYGRMACIEKSTGRLIGFSGMKYMKDLGETDVGYRFFKDTWGKGYATESARVLMRDCIREFGLRRVIGLCDRRNGDSAKVLVKLGMTFERRLNVGDYPGLLDMYGLATGL